MDNRIACMTMLGGVLKFKHIVMVTPTTKMGKNTIFDLYIIILDVT